MQLMPLRGRGWQVPDKKHVLLGPGLTASRTSWAVVSEFLSLSNLFFLTFLKELVVALK